MQRLVIDILVDSRCILHVRLYILSIPVRPVMALEYHVRLIGEPLLSLENIMSPRAGVANLRPAQRIEVVHRPGAVLSKPESAVLREISVHLRRSFRPGSQLELNLQAVDGDGLIRRDLICRSDKSCIANRLAEADTHGKLASLSRLEQGSVLIHGAASHSITTVDILRYRVLKESLGSKHRDLAGGNLLFKRLCRISHVLSANQSENASVMVDVRVAVQHSLDIQFAKMRLHEFPGRFHVLRAHKHIEHDPSAVRTDKCGIGHVIAANLVDAVAHLKKAGIGIIEGVAEQARIDGIRNRLQLIQEAVVSHIPDLISRIIIDHKSLRSFNKPAQRVFPLAFIRKVQNISP